MMSEEDMGEGFVDRIILFDWIGIAAVKDGSGMKSN